MSYDIITAYNITVSQTSYYWIKQQIIHMTSGTSIASHDRSAWLSNKHEQKPAKSHKRLFQASSSEKGGPH